MSDIPDINSYADARKHFDSVKPWRGSTDRPIGSRRHSNKRMRMTDDGSIEFEYQGHKYIVYRPDGGVDVEAFDFPAQMYVVQRTIPNGIDFLNINARVKPSVATAPINQVKPDRWWGFPYWVTKNGPWKDPGYPEWNNRKANPDVLVFQAPEPVRLNYYADRDMWLPDENALVPFEWDEIDKSASRKLNEEYKLGHFEAWVNAQIKLLADHGGREWPVYEAVSDDTLLDLIKASDFETAVTHFPRNYGNSWRYWRNTEEGQSPWLTHMHNLRTHLYKREGILKHRSEQIVSWPMFKRIKHLLYRFE